MDQQAEVKQPQFVFDNEDWGMMVAGQVRQAGAQPSLTDPELAALNDLARFVPGGPFGCIEIGTFCGGSACAITLGLLKHLFCVTIDSYVTMTGSDPRDELLIAARKPQELMVGDRLIRVIAESARAMPRFAAGAERYGWKTYFGHVDGDHEAYMAYLDGMMMWEALVPGESCLSFHDYNNIPECRAGVQKFCRERAQHESLRILHGPDRLFHVLGEHANWHPTFAIAVPWSEEAS